jgi:hypothetical protein
MFTGTQKAERRFTCPGLGYSGLSGQGFEAPHLYVALFTPLPMEAIAVA